MAYPTAAQLAADLLYSSNYWGGSALTFSFPGAGATWSTYDPGSEPFKEYQGLSASQQATLRTEFAVWDKLIALSLTETSDPGQIRVAFSNIKTSASDQTWGYAFSPPNNGGSAGAKNGDVWIDTDHKDSSFTAGAYDYMAAMHEIGHALGLKHSFEGDNRLPAEYDNYRYSIMSYTYNEDSRLVTITPKDGGIQSNKTGVYPTTPMLFDVVAIQARYGADTTTATGDTTYSFDQSKPTFMTIYDAGGTDTIDLSTHTRASIINLTPGTYSSIDQYTAAQQAADATAQYQWAASFISAAYNDPTTFTWTDNVAIAFNTTIENVRAGTGADRITGNDAANNISGGAGNDTIEGGAGRDYLRGDDGNDLITGGADFDDINGNRGNDSAFGGDGDDWVVGGQDNDVLGGDAGNDIVYGNLGNDTVGGGEGNDWVRGGQGDDLISGGGGADFISGDRGSDTISGGGGADRFNLITGAGLDRVTDFNSAEGDRVSIEGALPYNLSYVSGDAVIDIGNGDQMVLVGISNATQLGTWMFV